MQRRIHLDKASTQKYYAKINENPIFKIKIPALTEENVSSSFL